MPDALSLEFSERHFASTDASSIAMPAPCAAKGSMACAASPSSVIGPLLHTPPSRIVNNAHRRQSSTAPIIMRDALGHRDENWFLISLGLPGSLHPGRFQVPGSTATMLIFWPPEIG